MGFWEGFSEEVIYKIQMDRIRKWLFQCGGKHLIGG